MKTVKEIAEMYGVTDVAVRQWLKNGLPYKKEKVIGVKTRTIINPKDVELYHKQKTDVTIKVGD